MKNTSETGYFDFAKTCSLCKRVCQQGQKHKKQQKVEIQRTGLSLADIIVDRHVNECRGLWLSVMIIWLLMPCINTDVALTLKEICPRQ
jgi:hypothetical protein